MALLKIKSRPWLIWSLASVFFFAEYFARVSPSVMVNDLIQSFHTNALTLGFVSACFYYGYISMQIPVGILIDRYGAQKLLTVTALLCGISSILFASSHYVLLAELSRLLMGLTAAFAFVGALKLARTWFPANKFGFLAGATQALGMLGAAIGEGPVAAMVRHVGWQNSMVAIGGFLIILGLLIALFVKDAPTTTDDGQTDNQADKLLGNLICVLKNKQCWLNGIFIGFLYAPTAAFAELWGTSYLHHVFAISTPTSAGAISLIFIGFAIGSPFIGYLSDRIKRRKPVMLLSALFSFATISIVLYTPHLSFTAISILLFIYGISNVGVATCYAVAGEIVPKRMSATSLSFANMASVLIGAILQPIIGALLDHHNPSSIHALTLNMVSIQQYKLAMASLPICILVSVCTWFFIKESYPK